MPCAARSRTSTGTPLREGDRVAFFDVHRTCGRCLACTVHRTPTRCPSRRVYGITDSAAEGLFGGWAQKVYLEPGVIVAKLPDAVTFEAYIGGGCGLLTAVHIIERARITLGDTVVVQGAGAVGMSTAALAQTCGRRPGDRDRRAGRSARAVASTMGADVVIDLDRTTADERLERVLALTGGLGARRRRRSRRIGARVRRRRAPRAQRRRVRHRRPLHERRRQHDQRARAHQPQAPRHSRLLGQRGRRTSCARSAARALRRRSAVGARSARARTAWARSTRRWRRRARSNSEGAGRSVARTIGPARSTRFPLMLFSSLLERLLNRLLEDVVGLRAAQSHRELVTVFLSCIEQADEECRRAVRAEVHRDLGRASRMALSDPPAARADSRRRPYRGRRSARRPNSRSAVCEPAGST